MKMKTTVLRTGLATSLAKDGLVYTVSTVHRTEFGGYCQTAILRHPEMQMVYRIEVESQLGAAEEHIDTVRMALSKPESDWCGTKDYQDNLMNELCAGLNLGLDRPPKQEMSWTDERIACQMRAANIQYRPWAPRYVPILTGIFWIAVAIGILFVWREPEGVMYWVRGIVFVAPMFFGLHSLKIGLFASKKRINRLTTEP